MPVARRISDGELRERLEEHGYNVPPITDTTRAILIKKLGQLDTAARSRSRQEEREVAARRRVSGLDYSSAEDEEAPTPLASSTRTGRHGGHEDSAVTSRVTRHSNGGGRGHNHGSSRKHASLMTHSEEEGSEDEEEDDEEEVEEEEEEEEESEEEDDVNADRVDFAMQTSLLSPESPSPQQPRFRGQKLPTSAGSFSQSPGAGLSQNNNYAGSPPLPTIMSPYLRKNIKKHGSLNEALSTLPKSKNSSQHHSAAGSPAPGNTSSSILTQVSHHNKNTAASSHNNSSYNTSYSRDTEGPCSYMLVSSLIMLVAAVFAVFLAVQYLSLTPPQAKLALAVCGGVAGEVPGASCVPSSQLNDTVQLYKQLRAVLQPATTCTQPKQFSEPEVAELMLAQPDTAGKLWKFIGNLMVLLKQNQSWGIRVEEVEGEVYFSLVTSRSWVCSAWLVLVWAGRALLEGLWLITSLVAVLGAALLLYKLHSWRQARRRRHKEEVFQLVRQATNLLYQHHQISVRESGKSAADTFMAINHIRDQLIPLEERAAKAEVWQEAVNYIEQNESRVRQNVQKIYSEEFRVWQWLPEVSWSPHATEPFSPGPGSPAHAQQQPSSPGPASPNPWPHVPTTHAMSPGWQGCALPSSKQPPLAPPTSCLKVRHMFDVKQQTAMAGTNWVAVVKDEIVKRCSGEANILHIAVDTVSDEGTVYIKTASLEDAGAVFRCLHGQWYRGQLVTAKYLRLERYHERFPDSKYSNKPMTPSRK